MAQDMVALEKPGAWDTMKEEYNVLSLFPAGHIMARLRPHFRRSFYCSKDIPRLRDKEPVTTVGLVIRRQRPQGKTVFITLEDEFGHIPLMVFQDVYERYENIFKEPFLIVRGRMSRREGTHEIVVTYVKSFRALDKMPEARNWR